jgi:TonB family protein
MRIHSRLVLRPLPRSLFMTRFPLVTPLLLLLAGAPALAAQEPADGVYALADVETRPRPTNVQELVAALNAAYPADKRAAEQEATVSLRFVVGPDGVPRDVGVVESTDEAFDSVTVASVRMLRFTPATVAGRPFAVRVELPVQWLLPDTPRQAQAESGDFVGMGDAQSATEPAAPGNVPRVYRLSEVDVPPQPRNLNILPREMGTHYPPALRDTRTGGRVQVRFRVDTDGRPRDYSITHSTHPGFDQPSLDIVSLLRFTPARKDGRVVEVWVEQPIEWTVR